MTTRARGFTLLEVALAAVLGSIVVLAAVSMFASLDSAQKVGEETFEQANSSAMTHDAVATAIQNLLMSNTVAPPRNSQGERVRPGQDGTAPTPDAPPDPRDLERPRLLLEFDLSQPPVMVDPASQHGELMRPQRLEVTLRSRPVFVFGVEREESVEDLALLLPPTEGAGDPDRGTAAPGDEAGANGGDPAAASGEAALDDQRDASGSGRGRDRDRSRRAGEDRPETGRPAAGADDGPRSRAEERRAERDRERDRRGGQLAPDVTTELVQGVRGAFEFEFDPGRAAGGLEAEPGWVLWWRQLYPVVEAPVDMDPLPGQRVGAVRLMGNIASASWKVLYTPKAGAGQVTEPERLSEHAAVWADDLPSYFELDILSNTGDHHQWTFEVGWGVSAEPGTVQSTTGAAAGVAGAAAGGTRNPNSARPAAGNPQGVRDTLDAPSSGGGSAPRTGRGSSSTGGGSKSSGGGKSERRK